MGHTRSITPVFRYVILKLPSNTTHPIFDDSRTPFWEGGSLFGRRKARRCLMHRYHTKTTTTSIFTVGCTASVKSANVDASILAYDTHYCFGAFVLLVHVWWNVRYFQHCEDLGFYQPVYQCYEKLVDIIFSGHKDILYLGTMHCDTRYAFSLKQAVLDDRPRMCTNDDDGSSRGRLHKQAMRAFHRYRRYRQGKRFPSCLPGVQLLHICVEVQALNYGPTRPIRSVYEAHCGQSAIYKRTSLVNVHLHPCHDQNICASQSVQHALRRQKPPRAVPAYRIVV